MNMLLRYALATALLAAAAAPAAAGDLKLSIANGRVTLIAHDVTVSEILAEWARVGQTRIVNAEKLFGAPVTLELEDVPEAQALDTVLRSAAGYVMAPRQAGAPGASVYDRILILASSRPPAVTTPAPFSRPMQMPQANPIEDEGEVGPPQNFINGNGPNPAPGLVPQPSPAAQPQGPLTAPRPGMLPTPQTVPNQAPNPFLGAPPGPAAPGFNPNPPPPPQTPRGPGGGPGGA